MTRDAHKLALAWVLCLIIALGVECVLQLLPAGALLRYDQVSTDLAFGADYVNIRRAVAATQAPQICIIGSSRAKAIISAPTIRQVFEDHCFGDVDVRVYAAPNLNAAACLALTRLMKNWDHRPKIILYAVEPRQLADLRNSQGIFAAWLSNPAELYQDNRLCNAKAAAMAWADTHVRSLWLRETARLQPAVTSQVFGGYSSNILRYNPEFTGAVEHTMVVHSPGLVELKHNLWVVDCEMKLTPSETQRAYTDDAIKLMCRFSTPILVELPFPDDTMAAFPSRYYDAFIQFYTDVCDKYEISFVRNGDLGFEPENKCFGDATHANWSGAQEYSKLLAEKILIPEMKKRGLAPRMEYCLQAK